MGQNLKSEDNLFGGLVSRSVRITLIEITTTSGVTLSPY